MGFGACLLGFACCLAAALVLTWLIIFVLGSSLQSLSGCKHLAVWIANLSSLVAEVGQMSSNFARFADLISCGIIIPFFLFIYRGCLSYLFHFITVCALPYHSSAQKMNSLFRSGFKRGQLQCLSLFYLLLMIDLPAIILAFPFSGAQASTAPLDIDERFDKRRMTTHTFKSPFYLGG